MAISYYQLYDIGFIMIILLLSSLLQIITCTVYTVTPDDHYYPNTTCHHCHNLQHYLLNITKYFTSNTHLLFLPGPHYLHTDLVIQNVHNISLIGSTANGTTLDTVIQCNSSVGIEMINITDLTIRNMIIKSCNEGMRIYRSIFTLETCVNIVLNYMQIYSRNYDGLSVINALGKSRFSHISLNKIFFLYDEIQARNVSNTILIDHLQQVGYVNSTYITIFLHQYFYEIGIQLAHITFQQQHSEFLYGQLQNTMLSIMDCEFLSSKSPIIRVYSVDDNSRLGVVLINCKFIKTKNYQSLINIHKANVTVIICIFNGISCSAILESSSVINRYERITVVIKDTQFVNSVYTRSLIVTCVNLLLEGMVIFQNITNYGSIIELMHYSTIIIHGRIEFSNNSASQLIQFNYEIQYIKIKEPSIISIHHNKVCNYFVKDLCKKTHPFCIFQYFSNRTLKQSRFSIFFLQQFIWRHL